MVACANRDTIAAVATPAGAGAIAVIRISGPQARAVADRVVPGAVRKARRGWRLSVGRLRDTDGNEVDKVIVLDMPGPRSYTGEDIVELQCHGGMFITERVLRLVLAAGARVAEPGEFTKRAFLNGRLDLTQAEAVADLIAAASESELKLASSQLAGRLGRELRRLRGRLLDALALVEAGLDFAADELEAIDLEAGGRAPMAVGEVRDAVAAMLATYESARAIYRGKRVVLAGKPNVGKSSLLNSLLAEERAIVAPLPGTTRDIVESELLLGGLRVRLVDSAGLSPADSEIDKLGMARTREAINQAGLVVAIFDGSARLDSRDEALVETVAGRPVLAVLNKIDLPARVRRADVAHLLPQAPLVETSAVTGEGVPGLREAIAGLTAGRAGAADGLIVFRTRHRAALARTLESLDRALSLLGSEQPLELAAQELREAADSLGVVTGEIVSEDVLDRIFAHFCVGK